MMAWHAQLIFSLIVFKWLSYEYIWLPHSNMLPCYFEYAPSNMKSSAKTSTSKLHIFFSIASQIDYVRYWTQSNQFFHLDLFLKKKNDIHVVKLLVAFHSIKYSAWINASKNEKLSNRLTVSARLFRHKYSTLGAHFDDKYPFNEYTPILCVRIFFVLFRCLML